MRVLLPLFLILQFLLPQLPVNGQVDFEVEAFSVGQFSSLKNCAVDMNGDFLDDIVAVSGNKLEVYYQLRDGGFRNQVFRTELSVLPDWSICAGDIDANGFNDLIIGGNEKVSFIYANDNGSDYQEVVKPDFIICQRTSFADINNDGHLDAFVCHDIDENQPFVNDGQGNLTLDYNLIKTPENLPGNYTCTWVDYDNDGDIDMHMAKCVQNAPSTDLGRINLLYNNDGLGNYTEVAALAGLDDNDQSWVTIFEDFDNDGDFDAYTLNHEIGNRFNENNGDGTFTDIIASTGIVASDIGSFQALAADYNNDGNMDILIDIPARLYLGNGDNTFSIQSNVPPTGAIGDFNSDGFIDMLSDNNIYYNKSNSNHWLRVNVRGSESNRSGIGARAELHGAWGVQTREVRATQSWSPMNTLGIHFGLGSATTIDSLVISWPSGNRSLLVNPTVDQALFVDESDCTYETIEVAWSEEPFLCDGESTILTAPAGYSSYAWSTGEITQEIEVSEEGYYNVTVTDINQCELFSDNIALYSNLSDINIATPNGTLFCAGSSILLEVDTPYEVEWSNGRTENFIYVFEAGTYSVSGLSDCNTQPTSDTITITEFITPPPSVMDVYVDTTMGNPIIPITVDSNNPVIWWPTPVMGQPIFVGNTLYLSELKRDTVFYVQTFQLMPNGLECFSVRTPLNVFVTNGVAGITVDGPTAFCDGDQVTLTAPAGFVYNWTNGKMTQTIVVEESGTYAVTLTDSDGNNTVMTSEPIIVTTVPPPIVADVYLSQGDTTVQIELDSDSLLWWDAPIGGNLIHQGNAWLHTATGVDYTYYIEAVTTLEDGTECFSDRVPLTIYAVSSTNELEQERAFKLYPNPVSDILTVSMNQIQDIKGIKILDVNGMLVFQQDDSFKTIMKVDMKNFYPGIYLIQVELTEGIITKRIILNSN